MDSTMKMNDAKGFYKLSWLQRIGFGSGDLAQNLNLSDRMYVVADFLYECIWSQTGGGSRDVPYRQDSGYHLGSSCRGFC